MGCVGAAYYHAHKVKPPAIMMPSRRDAVSVIYLGFAVHGDSEHFEQPLHIGWIHLIPGGSEIATMHASARLRRPG